MWVGLVSRQDQTRNGRVVITRQACLPSQQDNSLSHTLTALAVNGEDAHVEGEGGESHCITKPVGDLLPNSPCQEKYSKGGEEKKEMLKTFCMCVRVLFCFFPIRHPGRPGPWWIIRKSRVRRLCGLGAAAWLPKRERREEGTEPRAQSAGTMVVRGVGGPTFLLGGFVCMCVVAICGRPLLCGMWSTYGSN